MKQKKLFWQIFPANLLIVLVVVLGVGWYSSRAAEQFYLDRSALDLVNRANLIKTTVKELLRTGELQQLRSFAVNSGRMSATRITVVDSAGRVLADSNENPAAMDNHRNRPEIRQAFTGTPGSSVRFSNTLGERMLYSAVPLDLEPGIDGTPTIGEYPAVLRLSVPITAIDAALSELSLKLFLGSLVAALAALLVTLFVSRNVSRPLEEMTKSARHYSKGDFSQRMMVKKLTASREVATLAAAMDEMADQLDEKIKTIIDQRNQLETVFSSMMEAVIAVDYEERIISINSAAAQMFMVDRRESTGRLVQEVIRNPSIHQKIRSVLETEESLEDEIVLSDGRGQTYLQSHAVSLYNGTGASVGVLVVLNDVTRLRRLEKVRKDFVANVSHELRTPITSIRGYVETLLDGAIDEREDALKFLGIVLRQSEQLSEIIDDLLALSRIEQSAEEGEIAFEEQQLRPLLENVLQSCRYRAEQREVELVVEGGEGIRVRMNPTLLEQAIVNLVINGITYSDRGGRVTIRAGVSEDQGGKRVRISVIDNGIGIAKEHLPRLFERFYRSDKARSRKAGGTGLGLAIVKHIVQAHGGEVEVKSRLGEGSEFSITLAVS